MAICPQCKNNVSEVAVSCPHCGCNIEEFKDNAKAQKKKAEAKRFEEIRLAAEKKRKAEELAKRLVCPDCETAVTLEDKICPKCGFPLDDKGERERMRAWRDLTKKLKPSFKRTWLPTIISGLVMLFFIWDISREDFLIFGPVRGSYDSISPKVAILGLPLLISVLAFIIAICSSISSIINYDTLKDNYETYLIERKKITMVDFIDRIKGGKAHCPYCKRRMTEKSFAYYPNKSFPRTHIFAICCEHCGKFLKFPGDEIKKYQEESHRKSQARKQRWGF